MQHIPDATLRKLDAIDEWFTTCREEIDDIGGWRDAPGWERSSLYWARQPKGKRGIHNSTAPSLRTSCVVELAIGVLPNVDPSSLLTIHDAIQAWHRDGDADNLPPQSQLDIALERAMQVLLVVKSRLERDAVATDPKPEQSSAGTSNPDIHAMTQKQPSRCKLRVARRRFCPAYAG